MFDLPSLLLVLSTAIVDSINPLSIGIFILVLVYLLGSGHRAKHLVAFSSAYIFSFFLSYLLIGTGLVYFFDSLSPRAITWLLMLIAIGIAVVGVLEVKDYFWYGRTASFRPPRNMVDKIHNLAGSESSSFGLMLVGVFVAIISLPAIGSPLLAITGILRLDMSWSAVVLIGLFSLVLIVPLIIILILVARMVKISHIARWKEQSKGMIRLFTGLMLVILSWLLIMTANGTINIG